MNTFNVADVDKFVNGLEEESRTKYIIHKVDRHFNDKDWSPLPVNRVYWQWSGTSDRPAIQYTGTPFMFVGSKRLVCHQGKDLCVAQKKRYVEEKSKKMMVDHSFGSQRSLWQDTKKVGCPAAICITKVALFPKFKVDGDRERSRKAASKLLRRSLERDPVVWQAWYAVTQPTAHVGHAMSDMEASIREPVDTRVEQRVAELTKQGVRKLSEVKRHLMHFVRAELFRGTSPPPPSRRRYFPSDKDLRNIMARARDQTRLSKIDQVNLEALFQKWRAESPEDQFHLRLHTDDTSFLLCHQTAWQRRLLHVYGTDICLFDATYRTTRYALPLFFLCVRTNVCFIVVGVMVVQEETTVAIKEGLEVFRSWNSGWKPAHFMVDYSLPEIKAVESVFEGTKALLCDFHREKAWGEWIRKQDHQVSNKDDILAKMRAIAKAYTVEDYEEAVKVLLESSYWRENHALQNWFTDTWLSEARRWVAVFKAETLKIAMTTNNGIERQNETFKHKYLEGYKDSTLSEMLEVVVKTYVPDMHRKYIEGNVRASSTYRRYNTMVPAFLWDRPTDLVRHIMCRMETTLCERHVVEQGDGVFCVKSETEKAKTYLLSFGTKDSLPSCQCDDWKRHKLPCKHFCAVFRYVPGWTWQQLCKDYREHPLLNLDEMCLSATGVEFSVASQPVACEETSITTECSECTTDCSLPLPPRRRARKTHLRKTCIQLTKQIMDKIYLTDDQDCLEDLSMKLKDLLADLSPHTNNEDGMPLHLKLKKSKVSASSNPVELPRGSTGRPKSKFTGRVGVQAEKMRKAHKMAGVRLDTGLQRPSPPPPPTPFSVRMDTGVQRPSNPTPPPPPFL